MAEPDAGVDVDGDAAVDGVLRRDADAPIRGELDGGGTSVLDGLPEERSAGQGVGNGGEQVHAAGGSGRQEPAACDGRRDRAGAGAGREAGIPADGRGREGRHRAADMGGGDVQRPWSAPGVGSCRVQQS